MDRGLGAYLASPIDQAGDPRPGLISLAASVVSRSLSECAWVYRPQRAFSVAPVAPSWPLRDINLHALWRADLLVALLPAGVPSVGVPMEIQEALALGMPVVLVSDAPSWMLEFPPAQADLVFRIDTMEEAVVLQRWPVLAELVAKRAHPPPHYEPDQPRLRQTGLPCQLQSDQAALPTFTYPDDAGLDLIVSQDTLIPSGQFVDVPHEIAVQLPPHTWGMITARSSALRRSGLLIPFGVIDAGYRGPLFAGAWNLTTEPVKIEAGSRICQLVLIPNETRWFRPVAVDELEPSPRGTNGFGSSGS